MKTISLSIYNTFTEQGGTYNVEAVCLKNMKKRYFLIFFFI